MVDRRAVHGRARRASRSGRFRATSRSSAPEPTASRSSSARSSSRVRRRSSTSRPSTPHRAAAPERTGPASSPGSRAGSTGSRPRSSSSARVFFNISTFRAMLDELRCTAPRPALVAARRAGLGLLPRRELARLRRGWATLDLVAPARSRLDDRGPQPRWLDLLRASRRSAPTCVPSTGELLDAARRTPARSSVRSASWSAPRS